MTLKPSIKQDDTITTGRENDSHKSLISAKKLKNVTEDMKGFSPDGKLFLTRRQAVGFLKMHDNPTWQKIKDKAEEEGLHSGDYQEAKGIKTAPDDISDMTVRCYDFGLFGYILEEMTEFKKREYYCPWESSFPTSDKAMIGDGVKGIERLEYFEPGIKDVDLFTFFDFYKGPLQEDLRSRGKFVFGSGLAEIYEIDRILFKETLDKAGLPVIPCTIIEGGIDELREWCKEQPKGAKLVIKSSCYRGDFETTVIDGVDNTIEDFLYFMDKLAYDLGVRKEQIVFICESILDAACEPGYDGVNSDGVFGDWGMIGYEKKGDALIGRMYKNDDLPHIIKNVNDCMAPFFTAEGIKKASDMKTMPLAGYRGLYSMESIITKKGKCFPLDICCRAGSPSSEVLCGKLIKNWSRVVCDVARGKPPKIEIGAKYGAILKFHSSAGKDNFDVEVKYPKEIEEWVKIRNKYGDKSKIYSISQDKGDNLGAVIGIGNTIKEATDLCLERIEMVHAQRIEWSKTAFDELIEKIKVGEGLGVKPFL
jgi:hypothetical protein